MAILLCSANDTVIQRWEDLLGTQYEFEQASTLTKLKSLCTGRTFDLILMHRPLVDTEYLY